MVEVLQSPLPPFRLFATFPHRVALFWVGSVVVFVLHPGRIALQSCRYEHLNYVLYHTAPPDDEHTHIMERLAVRIRQHTLRKGHSVAVYQCRCVSDNTSDVCITDLKIVTDNSTLLVVEVRSQNTREID